ncbi:MAG TPA: ATP-binding protein [Polyangia bacterium]|jgi:serine/threonine-protein kinase RsbW|nr:ATP-binding protein [Polyangia bacterium]
MQVVAGLLRANMGVVLQGATVCVEAPGEIAYRHVILRAAAAVCKLAITRACGRRARADGFSQHVVSAVGEAFNNIALHSYRDRPPDVVRLRMTIEPGVLHLTMEDYGVSFDPLTACVPDLEALPESGMGIFIMRSLMDEVTYQPGRPNVLSLRKRIGTCPSDLPRVSGKRT